MRPFYFPDFQRHSTFRVLDWRWQRAGYLVDGVRLLSRRYDDRETIAAARCLRALGRRHTQNERTRLLQKWPALVAAKKLAEDGGPLRDEVQARILAAQNDAEIAASCHLTPATVHWFECLFFCVRDRLTARDSVSALIGPGLQCGFNTNEMGRLWMAFAYAGGPLVLDAVMAVTAPSTRAGTKSSAATLRSADLAVRAMMIPADASLLQLAELHASVRRVEKLSRQADAPNGLSSSLAQLLDSLEVTPQDKVATPTATAAVA
jgi:hypothetical protein